MKSTKVKLLKMTEETPKIPAIEAKSPTKESQKPVSIKNKTLVNEVMMGEVHESKTFEND